MSAPVTVRYWAGARRAAGRDSEVLQAASLADLLSELARRRPELSAVLAASSVLVNAGQAGREEPLPPGSVVDILPPFAGG
jgi:molybdopterin synthase sulfur carrier subunit